MTYESEHGPVVSMPDHPGGPAYYVPGEGLKRVKDQITFNPTLILGDKPREEKKKYTLTGLILAGIVIFSTMKAFK